MLNTAESTHIMSRGLSTDHAMPKTLRRYLSLKSLVTRDVMVNQLRLSAALSVAEKAMGSSMGRIGHYFYSIAAHGKGAYFEKNSRGRAMLVSLALGKQRQI